MFTLYCITCTVSGKRYIGMTKHTPERRWDEHVRETERGKVVTLLYRAIRKYGAEKFVVEAIASARTRQDADAVERALIAQEETLKPRGYNMTSGGDGASGYKWTGAQKARSSALHKELCKRDDIRAMRSLAMKGKKHSDDIRNARSVTMKEWWAERKARGERNTIKPEAMERHRARMIGNQYTKGRKLPAHEIEKRTASLKQTVARRKLDARFNRPLWWKEWL